MMTVKPQPSWRPRHPLLGGRALGVALALTALLSACGWHPARFADRPPVTEVHDDRPIPQPRTRSFIEELRYADVYIRREIVEGLEPRRFPDALDVSSFDDVPTSSWYRQQSDHQPLSDYRRDGPPRPPFRASDEPPSSGAADAYRIVDARGLSYELQPDLDGRPGMRTAAAAIASRLVHALGYLTPEVYVLRTPDGKRVAATRWPIGVDLGPTPIVERRDDDPNDHLPHLERRSLRALKLVTAWLAMGRLPPRLLRDAYLGEPGKGHVKHFVVGLDGALGVDDYLDAVEFARDPDREDDNFFFKAFSLGMSPKPPGIMPQTPWPSVGVIDDELRVGDFSPSPPFEPIDRLQPGDAYWAAKVIAAVPEAAISEAIAAGELAPEVSRWLHGRLRARRAAVIAWGYDRTSPCELVGIERQRDRSQLVIADLAVASHFVPAAQRSYSVRFVDQEGEPMGERFEVPASGSITRISVPAELLSHPYGVALVQARRHSILLARPLRIHFIPDGDALRVVGLRH